MGGAALPPPPRSLRFLGHFTQSQVGCALESPRVLAEKMPCPRRRGCVPAHSGHGESSLAPRSWAVVCGLLRAPGSESTKSAPFP